MQYIKGHTTWEKKKEKRKKKKKKEKRKKKKEKRKYGLSTTYSETLSDSGTIEKDCFWSNSKNTWNHWMCASQISGSHSCSSIATAGVVVEQ